MRNNNVELQTFCETAMSMLNKPASFQILEVKLKIKENRKAYLEKVIHSLLPKKVQVVIDINHENTIVTFHTGSIKNVTSFRTERVMKFSGVGQHLVGYSTKDLHILRTLVVDYNSLVCPEKAAFVMSDNYSDDALHLLRLVEQLTNNTVDTATSYNFDLYDVLTRIENLMDHLIEEEFMRDAEDEDVVEDEYDAEEVEDYSEDDDDGVEGKDTCSRVSRRRLSLDENFLGELECGGCNGGECCQSYSPQDESLERVLASNDALTKAIVSLNKTLANIKF